METTCPGCQGRIRLPEPYPPQIACPFCAAVLYTQALLAQAAPPPAPVVEPGAARAVPTASRLRTRARRQRTTSLVIGSLGVVTASLVVLVLYLVQKHGGSVEPPEGGQPVAQQPPSSVLPATGRRPAQPPISPISRNDGNGPLTFTPGGSSSPSDGSTFGSSAARVDEKQNLVTAVRGVAADIEASMGIRRTLVVWLIDQTPSAANWRDTVVEQFDGTFAALARKVPAADDPKLEMAVLAFSDTAQFLVEEPTRDVAAVKAALAQVPEKKGSERIFQAIAVAAERYADYTRTTGGYVVLVVVSDEAGDDQQQADEVLAQLKRHQIRLHGIGIEAPFGREFWADFNPYDTQQPVRGIDPSDPLRQGPESLFSERIKLAFFGEGFTNDSERIPSGYGPYALTYVCQASGGTYFACEPQQSVGRSGGGWGWAPRDAHTALPRPGMDRSDIVFDSHTRRKYAPRYGPLAEYLQFVNSNAAARALHEAAKLPRIEVSRSLQLTFPVQNEAQLKQSLDLAQRGAARYEPELQTLYDILRQGERDRDALSEPRWQAGYDLAMGRCLAARVRVEGYNAMLAQLKGGRQFSRPGSSIWALEPAAEIAAGSTYERWLQQAQMYLNRVIKEHPGTPWAYLAHRELTTPLGWKWTER
jgi:hypothetical protein